MKKLTDEAIIKRKEIIELALKEFTIKGLEKTSVRDLCRMIGINGATMYYYFESKDDVILECVKNQIEHFDSIIKKAIDSKPEKVTDIFDKLLDDVPTVGSGIRFIAQVLASPNHLESCRNEMAELHKRYANYAERISESYSIEINYFKPLFYIFLTLIYDYLVKGDKEYFDIQMNALLYGFKKML